MTILSESADKKPEIETEKGLTEKQKKIDEKLIEIVMVIEQQQDMSDLRGIAEKIKEETVHNQNCNLFERLDRDDNGD